MVAVSSVFPGKPILCGLEQLEVSFQLLVKVKALSLSLSCVVQMQLSQFCHKVTLFSLLISSDVHQVLPCVHEFLSFPFCLYVVNLLSDREHFVITFNNFLKFTCVVLCMM